MKFKRFISVFLVAFMLLSAFSLCAYAKTDSQTAVSVKGFSFNDNFSTLLDNSVRYTVIDLSFEDAAEMINNAELQGKFDENIHFLTDCGVSIILRLDFEDELNEDFLAEAKTVVEYLYKRYTDYSKKDYCGYIGSYIIGKDVDLNPWNRTNALSLADACVNLITQSREVAKKATFSLGVSNKYSSVTALIDKIEEFTVSSPISLAVSLGNLTESSIEFSETEKKITPANIDGIFSFIKVLNNTTIANMLLCDVNPNGEDDTANAKIYAYTYYKTLAMGNISALILADDAALSGDFADVFAGIDTDKSEEITENLSEKSWEEVIEGFNFRMATLRTVIDTEGLLKNADSYNLSSYKKRLMSSLDSAQKIIHTKNGEYNSIALKFDTPVPPNLLVFDISNADEKIFVELCASTVHASYNLTVASEYAKQDGDTFTYVFDLTPLKEISGDLISVVINMYTLSGKKTVPVDSVELSHISLYSTRANFTVQMIFIIIILLLAISVPYVYYVLSKSAACKVTAAPDNAQIKAKKPVQKAAPVQNKASEQPRQSTPVQRPAQKPQQRITQEDRNKQRRDDFELL